ncbi:MAG: recombinase family protein [Candidatus Omnitrophota bacterium]
MDKVAIYTRVSTEDQVREGTSLEVQREFLEKFAQAQGWEVYYPEEGQIYRDDGYSGSSDKRPALARLMKDAKLKKFNIVLCHKIDRFARNNQLLLNLVKQLDDMGIGFKSASESFDTVTAAGKMALSMLGTVAQFERDRIIERVFPGMIKGVERGNWQGSRYAPYGYCYNKEMKLLEVVIEEAKIVSLIFTMYLSGQSTNQIAGYLYQKNFKTRSGGKFHTKLVGDILKNKVYLGKLVWNRHSYDKKQKTARGFKYVRNDADKVIEAQGRHQVIITLDEFNQVQDKLQRNRRGCLHRTSARDYPLSGILFCADCSHKFRGAFNTSNRQKGVKKRWYRCMAKQEHNVQCFNIAVTADEVEPQVFAILEKLMTHTDLKEGRVNHFVAEHGAESDAVIKAKKSEIEVKLRENLEQQKKLFNAYKNKLIAEEVYTNEAIDLRRDEQGFKGQLNKVNIELMQKERSEAYQRKLGRLLEEFSRTKEQIDPLTKKELLQLVFKDILIKNKVIVKISFYQPFARYWKELECNINQVMAESLARSYILLPTAVR